MKYNAYIRPSGVEFSIADDLSILDSAINSNIYLEHSCRDGSCGTCKAKLVQGVVNQNVDAAGLSDEDIKNGYILTCCARPESDVELEANYYPELSHIKSSIQPCKLECISFPAVDVAVLKLKFSPTASFKSLAGQYIQLIINGQRRSYSVANIIEEYHGVELHIKKVINGVFSNEIFNNLNLNQLLRLEGPFGTFFVRNSQSPIIFLAGGTGFAPVKAMVEKLLHEEDYREIYIYWGASDVAGFYSDLAEQWQLKYKHIKYIPVLSSDDNTWRGRKGLVHNAVLYDFSNLSIFDVYACGSPSMIDAARKDFIAHGLLSNNFYADAFVSSD